jgi:MurNAc alpha-1-phosphate uridylyltransferase
MIPVLILAGGKATRLGPLTEHLPKSLIEVAGRPFVEHQIELLKRNGYTNIVLLVGHLGEMIEEALGDGSRYGVKLRYCYDGMQPLGTGGAIIRALHEIADPLFFVLYGDTYLDCDYAAVEQNAILAGDIDALMTVYYNRNIGEPSNVRIRDGFITSYDKQYPDNEALYIDAGLGVFHVTTFYGVYLSTDLEAFYQRALLLDRLIPYEAPDRPYEIGSLKGLTETRAYLEGKR